MKTMIVFFLALCASMLASAAPGPAGTSAAAPVPVLSPAPDMDGIEAQIEALRQAQPRSMKEKVATALAIRHLKQQHRRAAAGRPAKKTNGGKSQIVAFLLVFFLGYLGIHRFYLGYTLAGVFQLLTFGGFVIWALIDLVRIAFGDLKPFEGEYEKG